MVPPSVPVEAALEWSSKMKLIEFKIETQVEKKNIYREATVHRAASFCSLLSGPLVTVECDTQEKKKKQKNTTANSSTGNGEEVNCVLLVELLT